MMRYRRNRASTIEATGNAPVAAAQAMPMMAGMPNQQYAMGGKPNGWNGDVGAAPGQTPWAVYQNSGKVPVNAMTANQQAQAAAQARKV